MLTSTSQGGLLRLGVSTPAVLSTQPLRPFPGPLSGPQAGTVLILPNQVTGVMVAPSRNSVAD